MKRFWIGAGLLILLLAVGLWVTAAMASVNEPIAQALESAAQAGLAGDLDTGSALVRQARDQWQRHWNGIASAADHGPMDEIDGLFAQTEAYAAAGQAWDFAACCARLSQLVSAMGEAHYLTWRNLL